MKQNKKPAVVLDRRSVDSRPRPASTYHRNQRDNFTYFTGRLFSDETSNQRTAQFLRSLLES